MSGGAFDYIEFLPDNILREIEKLENFANDEYVKDICHLRPKQWAKLVDLKRNIKQAKLAIQAIDTNFLHDVEWIASGDSSEFGDDNGQNKHENDPELSE